MNHLLTSLNNINLNSIKLGQNNVYPVEKLLDYDDSKHKYLVKWSSTSMTDTWLNPRDINPSLIADYNNKQLIDRHNNNLNSSEASEASDVTKAYIYTRISNKNTGVSLDVQRDTLMEYCKNNSIYVIDIKVDNGISASNMKHLYGLNEILEECSTLKEQRTPLKNEKIYVMVYDISRFSRNSLQALDVIEDLSKKKIDLYFFMENVSYNSSSNKHLIRTALSQSQFLSESVSEKVKRSFKYKKELGNHIGSIPYGYSRKDGKLVLNKDEIRLFKKVNEIFLSECKLERKMPNLNKSRPKNIYSKVVKRLPKTFSHIRGKSITCSTIKLMLKRYQSLKL